MDQTPSTPPRGGNAFRIALAAVLVLAAAGFFGLGLDAYLTLPALKAGLGALRQWAQARPLASAAGYFALYAVVTGLGLPGAAVMTVAGGALFGFAQGVVLASFASTLGAVLSCLSARYVLRQWVQARFGARLVAVNAGMEREGAFYLFTMRLLPALPFWAINLLMGLTPMPVRTYAWVSQAGMLPATMVFIYAGTRLALVESLADVLSPGLITAFALLGLFPLAARRLMSRLASWRRERGQK
ncbi:MAG: TVP38/TMEM64 family protein [Proteobacteria bacterium]|nr:TVP38/TMEM64 family protein [Pseudomonadota bacterium]MBU1596514.1 TVP38/TMEM64 family protein [Pseudomonadota bacterium]